MATATLKLTYFKPSGKYYSEGEIEVDSSTDWNTCIELVRFRFEGACLPGLVTGLRITLYMLIATTIHQLIPQS
ncbi:hypothetical protein AB6G19_23415 [Providencia manganoxydans]